MRFEVWLSVACLVACGDGVVGEDYLGTPLFDLAGAVVADEGATPAEPRLSLFWIGYDSRTRERQVVEQRTTVDAAFARFNLAVFEAPPAAALTFEGAGIALIVVYADGNDNGALNSDVRAPEAGPDTILGASRTHLVVYASTPIAADGRAGAILGPLEPGYHLFESDDSSCRFLEAAHCVGAGGLTRVDAAAAPITIRLAASPDAVFVPNPAVPGMTSGVPSPGSLYGP